MAHDQSAVGGSGVGGSGRRGRDKARRDRDEDEEDDEDDWDPDNIDPERIQAEQARYKNARWRTTKRTRALMGEAVDDDEEEQLRASNPLPGHIDPITLEEVVKPAISPYGHVMRYALRAHRGPARPPPPLTRLTRMLWWEAPAPSYSSWIKCLENAEICPLTKKPLKKSDLVVLTHANIDRYRDKIVQ